MESARNSTSEINRIYASGERMIAYSFRAHGNGAAGMANEGRWELAQHSPAAAYAAARIGYRAFQTCGGEQDLLARLHKRLGSSFPPTLVTSYYISLKTNPFVLLTGREGMGKAAFVSGFANALLGPDSGQFVTISSGSWVEQSGEHSYYRGMHERFGSLHFLETLQEAAAPENAGKVYLLLLRGLTIAELHHYFNELLRVGPGGVKRLDLPGIQTADQPILPPNIFITATLHLPRGTRPDQHILRNAGLIDLDPDMGPPPGQEILNNGPRPPVGFQRIMLSAVVHEPAVARARLEAILGRHELLRLGPSPDLTATLWRGGVLLTRQIVEGIVAFVANSFDGDGRGLFDRDNALRNAQIAYDAQLVQRALSRIDTQHTDLRRRVAAHAQI